MATKFEKAKFSAGEYLMYGGAAGKFVARFKYSRRDRAGFIKFLVENFGVEEYFQMLDGGMPPTKILETKGYISKTVKEVLAKANYPQTKAGFDAYINDSMARRAA